MLYLSAVVCTRVWNSSRFWCFTGVCVYGGSKYKCIGTRQEYENRDECRRQAYQSVGMCGSTCA